MSDELKPCPFCGGEAWMGVRPGMPNGYYVKCANEDCGGSAEPPYTANWSSVEATEHWNRRAADDMQKRLLPALTGLPDAIADHCCGRCPSFKRCFASEFKPECGIANVMRLADELRGVLESGE